MNAYRDLVKNDLNVLKWYVVSQIDIQVILLCGFFPILVQSKSADPLKSKHQLDLERAHFLVTQAFDEDEKGNVEDAIELYTEAVDLCLKTVSIATS